MARSFEALLSLRVEGLETYNRRERGIPIGPPPIPPPKIQTVVDENDEESDSETP